MTESTSSFSALLHLIRYARGYRRRIILASLCSALNTFFDIMPEILIGIAIDVVVNQESSFVASLGFTSPKSQIVVLGVLTFLIWVGESGFEYLYLILWRNLVFLMVVQMTSYRCLSQWCWLAVCFSMCRQPLPG